MSIPTPQSVSRIHMEFCTQLQTSAVKLQQIIKHAEVTIHSPETCEDDRNKLLTTVARVRQVYSHMFEVAETLLEPSPRPRLRLVSPPERGE